MAKDEVNQIRHMKELQKRHTSFQKLSYTYISDQAWPEEVSGLICYKLNIARIFKTRKQNRGCFRHNKEKNT